MKDKIRVMIVDDHHMVRRSLAMFLESCDDVEMVAEASNGAEALQLVETSHPDVILMDMMMPELNGVEATRLITVAHPEVQVIALTSFSDDSLVRDALEAGAMSYMLKNASLHDLTRAIKDAVAGRSTLAPEATQALIKSTRNHVVKPDQLTMREREVLALMVDGMTNRQISHKLSLGLSTVKFHVSSILAKLNAGSRTEAVALALQHDLLQQS